MSLNKKIAKAIIERSIVPSHPDYEHEYDYIELATENDDEIINLYESLVFMQDNSYGDEFKKYRTYTNFLVEKIFKEYRNLKIIRDTLQQSLRDLIVHKRINK